jgi:hypothetical protein
MAHRFVTFSRDGLHHTPENERHPDSRARAAGALRGAFVRSVLIVVLPMTCAASTMRAFR